MKIGIDGRRLTLELLLAHRHWPERRVYLPSVLLWDRNGRSWGWLWSWGPRKKGNGMLLLLAWGRHCRAVGE